MEPSARPADEPARNVHHAWFKLSFLLAALVMGFIGGLLALRLDDSLGSGSAGQSQELILSESEVIANVVDQVSPSVVSIKVETETSGGLFFNQTITRQSAGSGVIVDQNGLILTNRHVIPDNVTNVSVVLSDGTIYDEVDVVDRDLLNDIAFLQIKEPKKLTAARLGDSDKMRVGDKVIAIGNALGEFNNTVTTGIISGIGRPVVAGDGVESEQLQNLFQTDAAINPGNSGGPLVNINGEVVGINTAVADNAENVGFSIPINDIKPLVASVKRSGEIIRPFLGVRYVSLTPAIAQQLETKISEGAYLIGDDTDPAIIPGSPAAKAGLKEQDIILRVNGTPITVNKPLSASLIRLNVGDTAVLTIQRGEEEITVEVILETMP